MSELQLVLLKEVKGLGEPGQVIRVKAGYGRNYLLPQKLAVLTGSPEAKKIQAELDLKKEKKAETLQVKAQKKEALTAKRVKMRAKKAQLLKKKK